MQNRKIKLVPYNPKWPQIFQKEAGPIQQALGSNCVALHHFGSTSIPGLCAKPKIDILAVVHKLDAIDVPALEKLGFEARGEVIPSGKYFSKKSPHVHLHIFEEGNPLIEKDLNFRDYLRTHEEDLKNYASLKAHLAALHEDGMSYSLAKTEFIDQILAKCNAEKHL